MVNNLYKKEIPETQYFLMKISVILSILIINIKNFEVFETWKINF